MCQVYAVLEVSVKHGRQYNKGSESAVVEEQPTPKKQRISICGDVVEGALDLANMKKLIKTGAITDLQTLTMSSLFERAQKSIQSEERMGALKKEYKANFEAFSRTEDTAYLKKNEALMAEMTDLSA